MEHTANQTGDFQSQSASVFWDFFYLVKYLTGINSRPSYLMYNKRPRPSVITPTRSKPKRTLQTRYQAVFK
jgi:hypothetical protein